MSLSSATKLSKLTFKITRSDMLDVEKIPFYQEIYNLMSYSSEINLNLRLNSILCLETSNIFL